MLLTACGNDDDELEVRDEFQFNDTSYALSKGFLQDYGANQNPSFDWDVTLTSEDILYSETSASFNGSGDVIYLDLNTSSADGLVDGVYNFASERNSFTLVQGIIGLSYDLGNATGEDFTVIGGRVEITTDGTEKLIEFDLTASNGQPVTGQWKGNLRRI